MTAGSETSQFNEPRGHGGRYSKIERIWSQLPAGHAIRIHRVERFDYLASLLYSPLMYVTEDISPSLPAHPPDEDWVASSFVQFVKGEFGTGATRLAPASFASVPIIADAANDIPEKYLSQCEAELVYGGILRGLEIHSHGSIEDDIFRVLASPILGNPSNARYWEPHMLKEMFGKSILEHKRLQFVIPSFPFKDQNVFRTEAPPDHIDLGDIALLVRLHTLALAFFQIHPFGADWIILADGLAYAQALGVDQIRAEAYRENLRDWRNRLNLQGTVTILDLNEVANHTDGKHFKGRFQQRVLEIRQLLDILIGNRSNINETFEILVRGMAWNLSTREYANHYSKEEIWAAVTSINNRTQVNSCALTKELRTLSEEAATYYAAFNLALQWNSIPQCIFPEAVRATVHAKPGQIAIPTLGTVYPWNGVPIVSKGTFRANDVQVSPICEVQKSGIKILGHAQRIEQPALYYTLENDEETETI